MNLLSGLSMLRRVETAPLRHALRRPIKIYKTQRNSHTRLPADISQKKQTEETTEAQLEKLCAQFEKLNIRVSTLEEQVRELRNQNVVNNAVSTTATGKRIKVLNRSTTETELEEETEFTETRHHNEVNTAIDTCRRVLNRSTTETVTEIRDQNRIRLNSRSYNPEKIMGVSFRPSFFWRKCPYVVEVDYQSTDALGKLCSTTSYFKCESKEIAIDAVNEISRQVPHQKIMDVAYQHSIFWWKHPYMVVIKYQSTDIFSDQSYLTSVLKCENKELAMDAVNKIRSQIPHLNTEM